MRAVFLLLICGWLVGCVTATKPQAKLSDPVDQLVAKLSSDELWMNGYFNAIDLPPSASAESVLTEFYQYRGQKEHVTHLFPKLFVATYQIIEIRQVQIGSTLGDKNFIAVLVDTNLGKKIVLLQYENQNSKWWSRSSDANPSA